MYLLNRAKDITGNDLHEPTKKLSALDEIDHLKRCLRLCVVHFCRNLTQIKTKVSKGVFRAMQSLASTEEHTDFEGALEIIRNGGDIAKSRISHWHQPLFPFSTKLTVAFFTRLAQ